MQTKIKLLFTVKEGVDTARLRAPLEAEVDRINAALDAPVGILVGKAVDDPALHVIAAGAFDPSQGYFDVMLEIILPDDAVDRATTLLTGLADRLAGLVDRTRSSALVGSEYVVLPGDGGTFVLIANRRLSHLTHDEFIAYWQGFHAEFTRTHTPPEIGMRYRQFHTDVARTEALSAATRFQVSNFDGAAECYYPDDASLRSLMAISEIVDEATVDEVKFVDHQTCVTTVFRPSADFAIL